MSLSIERFKNIDTLSDLLALTIACVNIRKENALYEMSWMHFHSYYHGHDRQVTIICPAGCVLSVVYDFPRTEEFDFNPLVNIAEEFDGDMESFRKWEYISDICTSKKWPQIDTDVLHFKYDYSEFAGIYENILLEFDDFAIYCNTEYMKIVYDALVKFECTAPLGGKYE